VDKARSDVRLRNDALYVAFEENLEPTAPRDVVTKEKAEDMIQKVRHNMEFITYAEWLNGRLGTKAQWK